MRWESGVKGGEWWSKSGASEGEWGAIGRVGRERESGVRGAARME